LKPRSKEYREERIAALLKSWQGLDKTDVAKITKSACLDWAAGYASKVSSTNFNNTIGTLRQVLEIAVEAGARYGNPAKFMKRVPVRFKAPTLPSAEQFEQLLGLVKHKKAADLARFLAYGGFRLSEAAEITWADVDLQKDKITVRGDKDTGTKNGEVRVVPIADKLKTFLERLQAENPNRKLDDRVIQAKECRASLATACKKLGIPKIHHHALRHFFATRAVESGGSLPAVAKLVGHKDGGVLLAKRYNHVSDEHLTVVAKRISFGASPAQAPAPKSSVTIPAADHEKLLAELESLRAQVAASTPPTTPTPPVAPQGSAPEAVVVE
jgi:integrase